MGMDANMRISFYMGLNGYDPDYAAGSGLIGIEVKDADLSFWGGAVIRVDGTVTPWGPSTVYCNSATSIGCQPAATGSATTTVIFALANVPSATNFDAISCAGKRGSQWCCDSRGTRQV
ncbi:unnamed protein product [Amoebophrya sp. A25]|nr:unnamed protein product [Amoebophrya sp. A25]|eukprot:GSA25T00013816001.1